MDSIFLSYAASVLNWFQQALKRPLFKIAVAVAFIGGGIFISWNNPILSFWLILLLICIYLSSRFPVFVIILMVISSGLLPKINIFVISFNIIGLRLEDVLITSLAVASILNYARGRLVLNDLSAGVPFIAFICIGAISLLRGIFIQTIDKPVISLFVMFKWVEYLIIFYLSYLYIDRRVFLKLIIITLVVTGIAVSFYGWWEYLNPKSVVSFMNYYRLYDRGIYLGQNNHMAGFLVLWFSFILGILFYAPTLRLKLILWFSALFGVIPFISTYSRKSYIALLFSVLSLFFLIKRKRYLLIFLMSIFVISIFFGPRIIDRLNDIKDFFLVKDDYQSQRFFFFKNWINSLKTLQDYPLIGAGFGSRHRLYYESQWVMILAETGILGFVVFLYLLWRLFKNATHNYTNVSDWLIKGFLAGFIAAFCGILIHSLTCVSMVIARTAIPFWITAGVICRNISGDRGYLRK